MTTDFNAELSLSGMVPGRDIPCEDGKDSLCRLEENRLLRSLFHNPDDLYIRIRLYRLYMQSEAWQDAENACHQVLKSVAADLGWPEQWNSITPAVLSWGLMHSFIMVRTYLLTLKDAAYIAIQLGSIEEARAMLAAIVRFDKKDLTGAASLLQLLDEFNTSLTPVPMKMEA